jgi:hypothetical protein
MSNSQFWRARGIVMDEVLCYKPGGRGFETRLGECFFFSSIYLILPAVLSPWFLTEMTTRRIKIMFLGTTERPVRRADNLTAICKPTV